MHIAVMTVGAVALLANAILARDACVLQASILAIMVANLGAMRFSPVYDFEKLVVVDGTKVPLITKIHRLFSLRTLLVVAFAASAVYNLEYYSVVSSGIVRALARMTGVSTGNGWSLIVLPIVMLLVTFLWGAALYRLGWLAGQTKLYVLRRIRKKRRLAAV